MCQKDCLCLLFLQVTAMHFLKVGIFCLHLHLFVLCVSLFLCLSDVQGVVSNTDQTTGINNSEVLVFWPSHIDGLIQGQTQTVYFNYSDANSTPKAVVEVSSDDDSIAKVVSVKTIKDQNILDGNLTTGYKLPFQGSNNTIFQHSLTVRGEFMGRTHLKFMTPQNSYSNDKFHYITNSNTSVLFTTEGSGGSTQDGGQNWREIAGVYDVTVVRTQTWVDYLFFGVVTIVVLSANVFMGFKIDLEVVKEVLKKPLAPGIGFVCQFIVMPLVGICVQYFFYYIMLCSVLYPTKYPGQMLGSVRFLLTQLPKYIKIIQGH